MGKPTVCFECDKANALVRGAKCARHESSTSPHVDRRRREDTQRGTIGPVPFLLAGGRR